MLVVGDFNANLEQLEGDCREEEISTALTVAGVEDMLDHFLPRQIPCFRDSRTWIMVWLWREVWSRTDYILGADHSLFGNVAVQDPRHNSDHYLVLGNLRRDPLKEHTE